MRNPTLPIVFVVALLAAAAAPVARAGPATATARAQEATSPAAAAPASSAAALRVRGTVTDKNNKPAPGCPVYLISNRYEPGEERSPITLVGTMTTDANGRFAFENAPPRPKQGYVAVLARKQEGAGSGAALGVAAVPVAGDEPLDVVLRPTEKARGTVKDSAGKPLAGVIVSAESISIQSPDAGPGGWASTSLPDELKKTATARTDARGEYRLDGLLPQEGNVSFSLQRDGYNRGFSWASSQQQTPRQVVLYRRTRIQGVFQSSDPAMALDGFYVQFRRQSQDGPGGSGKVASDGTFEIEVPPGAGKLSLTVPLTSPWQPQAEKSVTVAEGKTIENLVVPVEAVRGIKVSGRVVDEETGQGIPDFWLNVPSGYGFNTDKQGGYVFYARPSGKIGVTVHANGGPRGDYIIPGDGVNRSATAAAGGQDVTLDEVRLRKGKSLVVRVVDKAGKPVKGATVSNEASAPWYGRTLTTNARGETTLQGLAPDATVRLSAQSRTGFAAPVSVDMKTAAVAGPVTLVVKPELAVRLFGRVLDDANQPVVGASVQVSAMYERWGNYPATLKTDKQGRFRSDALAPGPNYSVKVQAPRHRSAASPTWKAPAESGGAHDFGALRLVRQQGFVAGVVLDAAGKPVAGARVFNSGDADQRIQTTSDARGQFRLDGLEKGACYVAAEKPGHPLGLLRADAPQTNARLVLRPRPLAAAAGPISPTLVAARERFALQMVDRTIRETEGKKNREYDRQRIVDLLVVRDTLRATELALRTGQACRNSLSNDLGRLALARSVDEAIGCVRQVDHPFWRTRNLLDLARDATPAQARKILPVAVASGRTVPELMQQLYLLAECADQMRRLQMPGAESLLRECAARAARLGVKETEAYYRGLVAERLAEIDLDAGMALITSIQDNNERQRHLGNVAVRYVVRSPNKALQILDGGMDSWQAQSAVARMCARLAASDPDQAEKMLPRLTDQRHRVTALLWMAERIKNRNRAHATLAQAEQALVEWATASNASESAYDNPALFLAHAALVAKKIGYSGASGLLARALAARPPLGSRYDDASEGHRTQAKLAVLVALADPETGREFVGALLPRLGSVKVPKYTWMEQEIREDLLCAAALADPARAAQYLAALTKSGRAVSALDAAEFVLDSRKQQERIRRTLSFESPEEDQ